MIITYLDWLNQIHNLENNNATKRAEIYFESKSYNWNLSNLNTSKNQRNYVILDSKLTKIK